MLINRLKLAEFGPHKELDITFGPGLIGLTGANSKGKTTILRAMEFALTGSLPDSAETYVRRIRGEGQAANATVVMEFTKNGMLGQILRQVGKTAKRQLIWDGQTHTKAAEIDRILGEIFNADKAAIASAIFLAQGDMGRMLFAPQSAREVLFQRLLLISYMPNVEAAADAQIKLLSSSLEDFGAVADELRAQMVPVRQSLDELGKTEPVSVAADITSCRALQNAIIATNRVTGQLEKAEAEVNLRLGPLQSDLAAARAALDVHIASAPVKTDREGLKAILINRGQTEQAAADRLRKARAIGALLGELDGHRRRVTELTVEREHKAAELATIPADIDTVILDRQQLSAAMEAEAQAQARVEAAQAALAAAYKPDDEAAAERDMKALEAEADQITPKALFTRQQVKFLEGIGAVVDCCPFCNSKVDAAQFPTLETLRPELAELDAELTAKRQKWKLRKDALDSLRSTAAEASANVMRENRALEACMNSRIAAANRINETARAEDMPQLLEWQRARIGLTAVIGQTEKALRDLAGVIANIERQLPAERETVSLECLEAAATEARADLDQWRSISDQWQVLTDRVSELSQTSQNLTTLVENARRLVTAAQAEESTARLQVPSNVPNNCGLDELTQHITALETHEHRRSAHLARVTEVQAQLDGLTRRLKEIEKAQEAQEVSRRVIAELETLRKTFGKNGLPATFLSDRFNRLTAATNTNLAQLQANFVVRSSAEEILCFEFLRMDSPDAEWLDQGKLSGGQRIRLSVAFLLAVQQLVIPDVGLLVMDEPSTHLDAEGVDAMRDLLALMSVQFASREAQIVVCDHNPRLIPFDRPAVTLP